MFKLNENQIIETEISDITYKGKGVSKINNLVVFLDKGVPGDKVKAKVIKVKKNYADAVIVELQKPSSCRINPQCPHFQLCGGCQFQDIEYKKQLEYKTLMVRDSLIHIGRIATPVNPIFPSSKQFYYRNQVQLKAEIGEKIILGFCKKDSHQIVKIDSCMLQTKIGNDILNGLNDFFTKNFKVNTERKKILYNIIIRISENEKKAMLIFDGHNFNEKIVNYLAGRFNEIKCISRNDETGSSKVMFGDDDFFYSVKGLNFKISSDNFWQVNNFQLNNMIEIVLNYAKLTKSETVLDAYCGVGFFSLFMAQKCKFVYGIEISSKSIDNAKKNAKLNNILNIKFFEEDVENVLKNKSFPELDMILLDPPRRGCSIEVLKKILIILPKKIIYISCDPATLSRDLKILCADKYNVIEIQPVDMFPQTYHIECIVYLAIRCQVW